jgi:hypothetical protein
MEGSSDCWEGGNRPIEQRPTELSTFFETICCFWPRCSEHTKLLFCFNPLCEAGEYRAHQDNDLSYFQSLSLKKKRQGFSTCRYRQVQAPIQFTCGLGYVVSVPHCTCTSVDNRLCVCYSSFGRIQFKIVKFERLEKSARI